MLNLLANKCDMMYNYARVVREVLLIFSKLSNEVLSQKIKISIIKYLLKNIERKQFMTSFLPRYLNDKSFNSTAGAILVDVLLSYPSQSKQTEKNEEISEFISRAIESGLALWGEASFVQNASIKHLKCNFLITIYK